MLIKNLIIIIIIIYISGSTLFAKVTAYWVKNEQRMCIISFTERIRLLLQGSMVYIISKFTEKDILLL